MLKEGRSSESSEWMEARSEAEEGRSILALLDRRCGNGHSRRAAIPFFTIAPSQSKVKERRKRRRARTGCFRRGRLPRSRWERGVGIRHFCLSVCLSGRSVNGFVIAGASYLES